MATQRLLMALLLAAAVAASERIAPDNDAPSAALDTNALNDTKSTMDDDVLLLRQYNPIYGGPSGGAGGGFGVVPGVVVGGPGGPGGVGAACPLCDSSVYSYCSYKMIHDSCCCDFMAAPQLRPSQCYYSDCTLLYAKTCYEHMLIKHCCCNRPYR